MPREMDGEGDFGSEIMATQSPKKRVAILDLGCQMGEPKLMGKKALG
jgi:hypothetical protein